MFRAKFLTSLPNNNVKTLVIVRRVKGKVKDENGGSGSGMNSNAIKFCVNLGHTPTETFNLLRIAGDAPVMKKSTDFNWHTRFKQGSKSIEDDSRSGRAKIISDKLVTFVSDVVEKDRRQTVREISETVGSSCGTVRSILHDHLHMNRLCT